MNKTRPTSAFTLVEMVAAVAIVFLLIGLILPAAHGVRQAARRRQAATETRSLLKAVRDYRAAYGHWPRQTQDAQDTTHTQLVEIVAALTVCPEWNPRQILFLERPDGPWLDPWGRSYVLALDENGDGHTTLDLGDGQPTNYVNVSAVALSFGPNPGRPDDRIEAW